MGLLLLPLILPLFAVAARANYFLPLDCAAVRERNASSPSGVYAIYPSGPLSPLRVYCDMESDGGGWTVFQRRLDGSVNFFRPWDAYKTGFGSTDSEFWLGLENVLLLTLRTENELRVDMEDWEGNQAHAHYASMALEPEAAGYTLTLGRFVDGKAGNALQGHNGMKFTTFDKTRTAGRRTVQASTWEHSGTTAATLQILMVYIYQNPIHHMDQYTAVGKPGKAMGTL